MIPISQDEINHISDRTCLVQGSVNIVNRNGFGELPGMEPVALSIVMVLGDTPLCPMSPPIFLSHLCIFLLIVASLRRSALAAAIPESDDHVT